MPNRCGRTGSDDANYSEHRAAFIPISSTRHPHLLPTQPDMPGHANFGHSRTSPPFSARCLNYKRYVPRKSPDRKKEIGDSARKAQRPDPGSGLDFRFSISSFRFYPTRFCTSFFIQLRYCILWSDCVKVNGKVKKSASKKKKNRLYKATSKARMSDCGFSQKTGGKPLIRPRSPEENVPNRTYKFRQ